MSDQIWAPVIPKVTDPTSGSLQQRSVWALSSELPFAQLFTASLTPHFNCQESFNLSAKKTNWEIFETSPGGILKSMSSSCVSLGIDILIFKKYIAKEVDTVPLNKPKYQAIRPQLSKLLAHLFNRMLGSYKNDDVDLNLLKCVHSNFG